MNPHTLNIFARKKRLETAEDEEFMGAKADALYAKEYENCIFRSCDFQEADLSGMRFVDCRFEDCNLSMCKMSETAFREVIFVRCKMFTMPFDQCNPIGLKFDCEHCAMDGCMFTNLKLGRMRFTDCILYGVDFTNTYLSESVFAGCDLMDAHFENTCLEKADFRTARDFEIDPERNVMSGAKFARTNLAGLVRKYRLKLE
jgi:fluoroquinolone resistance protein